MRQNQREELFIHQEFRCQPNSFWADQFKRAEQLDTDNMEVRLLVFLGQSWSEVTPRDNRIITHPIKSLEEKPDPRSTTNRYPKQTLAELKHLASMWKNGATFDDMADFCKRSKSAATRAIRRMKRQGLLPNIRRRRYGTRKRTLNGI